jgi:hypothetical protein
VTAAIGLHVAAGEVRAAVVEVAGAAVEVVATRAERRTGGDDPAGALALLAAALSPGPDVPARVAWETGPATVTDVGGCGASALDALFRRRALAGDDTVAVSDRGGRRIALTLAWDGDGAATLLDAARRAGFAPDACEPAALAASRLASGDPAVGAALGAGGGAPPGPLRPLRPATDRRPWVIERVADEPVAAAAAVRWWRRMLSSRGSGDDARGPAR